MSKTGQDAGGPFPVEDAVAAARRDFLRRKFRRRPTFFDVGDEFLDETERNHVVAAHGSYLKNRFCRQVLRFSENAERKIDGMGSQVIVAIGATYFFKEARDHNGNPEILCSLRVFVCPGMLRRAWSDNCKESCKPLL